MQIDNTPRAARKQLPFDERGAEHGNYVGPKPIGKFDYTRMVNVWHFGDQFGPIESRFGIAKEKLAFTPASVTLAVA